MNRCSVPIKMLIISFFLSSLWIQAQTIVQDGGVWCNPNYNFCVKYPVSLLPLQNLLAYGEGVLLKTNDALSSVNVFAAPLPSGLTPQELYANTLLTITGTTERPAFQTTIFGDDYHVAFFMWENNSYYQKSYFYKSYYIVMLFTTQVNKPELMTRLREDVELQLNLR